MIDELLLEIGHISAVSAALISGWVALRFMQLARGRHDPIGHLAIGLALIHSVIVLRAVYWDVLRPLVPGALWDAWYDASHGTAINLLFNGLVIVAGYYSLRSLRTRFS